MIYMARATELVKTAVPQPQKKRKKKKKILFLKEQDY